jgi:superfamily II DNA or RNA helicase
MIGLYLLTTNQLAKDETIKFGMSMRIEYRWIDYLAIFSDSKYVYYYEFLDKLTREEILVIEDEILQLHKNERNDFFQTEYFYSKDNKKFHKSIINVLDKRNIKYEVHDTHNFDRKYYDNNKDNEPLDRTLELEKNKITIIKKKSKVPRDYQIEIIDKSIEYYQKNDKGMLILICGVGKTLISLWITIKLNLNKILIGVPNTLLLEQWEEVIKGNEDYYGVKPDIKILIVDKDCNKDKIIKFLKDNEKCIVITTYHSSNKILDATNESNYIFDIKINDECHHLTTSDMELANTRKAFVQMLSIKSKKQISLTATLKQIEINDTDPNIISNENKEFFGDIIDKKNMIWAINKNIICDYVIQTIITEDVELEDIINKFDISEECDKRLFLSAYITLKSITEHHSHHLLIYTNKQENADKIIHYAKLLIEHKYFNSENLFFDSYHSGLDEDIQNNIIKKFDDNDNAFISCVYSLGEGWDFPKLDGVVFAETMNSNIRIVQSALRASRKNTEEPNKIAKMIIPILYNENWLDSNNDDFKKIKEIIYQLGLEDETIMTKVKVLKIEIDKKKIDNKLESNITGKIGKYQNELTEKLKLQIIHRHDIDITYDKARKIIQEKKIKNISYEEYINICSIDCRLPINPEEKFKNQFSTRFDYLGLNRSDYYDKYICINKVNEYISKNNIFDCELTKITKKLQNSDNKFPPFDVWNNCYNVNDLSEIIKLDNNSELVIF